MERAATAVVIGNALIWAAVVFAVAVISQGTAVASQTLLVVGGGAAASIVVVGGGVRRLVERRA